MRHLSLITIIVLFAACAALAEAPATWPADQAARPAPTVDVVFVLDTTGSMSGLIEGAKAKIWHIANQIVLGEPRPVVRMGLVGYRDKGDLYVTKAFDLTDNIDQVYKDLMGFSADGGGDGPEHVNQALKDAVEQMHWSDDKNALKIIYLVGDSPPHNEYADTPTYDKLAKAAIAKGIYVNAILCGGNQETARIWQEITRSAEGEYFAIEQDGGVKEIATPYDAELSRLNRELVGTVVVYGNMSQQRQAGALNMAAASMPSSGGAADRAEFASKSGRAGSGDLLQALRENKVVLGALPKDELPAEMQSMSGAEQTKYVAAQQAKRDEVNKQIAELSAKRTEFLRQELEKMPAKPTGFDAKVVDALQKQAEKKNINYKQ